MKSLEPIERIPGADRPEGALSWLSAALTGGGDLDCSPEIEGVVVCMVAADGTQDARVFGALKRRDAAWMSARLLRLAIEEP